MLKIVMAVVLIAVLKTVTAFGQDLALAPTELAAQPARGGGRGDGTLPLGETEASDGTLPLRLPSDGTLPLRLRGNSGLLPGGQMLTTQITITRATAPALPPAQRASLVCQVDNVNVSKHAAAGTIVVGDQTFTLKGICYDHATNNMELVGERRGVGQTVVQSFMIGLLPAAEPRQFQGRMTINGQAQTAQRFTFDVSRAEPLQPVTPPRP